MPTDNPILAQTTKPEQAASTEEVTQIKPTAALDTAMAAVQSAIDTASSYSQKVIAAQDSILSQIETAGAKAKRAVEDRFRQQAIIQKQADIAELEAQNNRRDILSAQDPEFQKRLLQMYRGDVDEMLAAQEEKQAIIETERTGLAPIDAIINNLIIDYSGVNTKLSAAARRVNRDRAVISSIASNAESITRAQNAVKETVTTATIAAKQKETAAQAAEIGAKYDLQVLSQRGEQMSRVMSAKDADISRRNQAYTLYNSEESRKQRAAEHKLQIENLQFRRDQFEANKESAELALKTNQLKYERASSPEEKALYEAKIKEETRKLENAESDEAAYISNIQQGYAITGQTVPSVEVIRYNLQGATAQTKDHFLQLALLAETGSYGTNPVEAVKRRSKVGGAASPASELLDYAQNKLAEDIATDTTGAYKTQEAKELRFNQIAETYHETAQSNIKPGDNSNPMHAPPMAVLSEIPGVKESKLYRTALEAMDMKEIDPSRIFDAAIAGMEAGTIKPEEVAKGINIIFSAAADYNTQKNDFLLNGLPAQTKYGAELLNPDASLYEQVSRIPLLSTTTAAISDIFTGERKAVDIAQKSVSKVTVNLMDYNEVLNYLIKLGAKPAAKAELYK